MLAKGEESHTHLARFIKGMCYIGKLDEAADSGRDRTQLWLDYQDPLDTVGEAEEVAVEVNVLIPRLNLPIS